MSIARTARDDALVAGDSPDPHAVIEHGSDEVWSLGQPFAGRDQGTILHDDVSHESILRETGLHRLRGTGIVRAS